MQSRLARPGSAATHRCCPPPTSRPGGGAPFLEAVEPAYGWTAARPPPPGDGNLAARGFEGCENPALLPVEQLVALVLWAHAVAGSSPAR